MTVFVDTSALYALLDRADAHHKQAVAAWTDLLNGDERFVTSNYVFVESFALTQSRLGMDAARLLQEDILPIINIHFADREIHRSGISAVLSAGRRNLSFVDCVSFEIMRTLGIKTAFTFDPHFREQGFTVNPQCSVSKKGLQDRHSGLDPESSVFSLDLRVRGNEKS